MSEIRAIRDALGLTQAQLAAQLGVTQSTVSRLETGEITPDRRTMLAAHALKAAAKPARRPTKPASAAA
ncbi:helix-turn-helix domain-containing protein [Sphingobium yanoikuyae]